MKYDYYLADVFTDRVFNGAQIAVLPKADGLTVAEMQLIARELNLSETIFISQSLGAEVKRRMHIFSPIAEINFAGHPIIAAAYILGLCGDIQLVNSITTVWFEQNAGLIEANITSEQGQPNFIQFTQTVSPFVDYFAPNDEELVAFLGLQQSELDHRKYSPLLVYCGLPYLIVPVWNYDSVRKARFNFAAWSQSVAPQTAAQEILLFAPKSPYPDADFHVRLLGPHIGLHDDPPIGSAMPAFCSYLCSFEHTRKGTHVFAVDRGIPEKRRSVLNLEMDNKQDDKLTIRIGGRAVLAAKGEIYVS